MRKRNFSNQAGERGRKERGGGKKEYKGCLEKICLRVIVRVKYNLIVFRFFDYFQIHFILTCGKSWMFFRGFFHVSSIYRSFTAFPKEVPNISESYVQYFQLA